MSPPAAARVDVTPDPIPEPIAAQPTGIGRALRVAHTATDDGHLLLVYGNYGPNDGPISVIGYRPSDGDVVTYLADLPDEQIKDYRRFDDGSIWSCNTDPSNRDDAQIATDAGGTWRAVTVHAEGLGPMVHCFDVAQIGSQSFACGSRNFTEAEAVASGVVPFDYENNDQAIVWASSDGGATWVEDLAVPKLGDGMFRFYGFGRIGDMLVVAAADSTGHWCRIDGVWSEKRTTPALTIDDPPVWSSDGTEFATAGTVYTIEAGALTLVEMAHPVDRVLCFDPDAGWVYVDTDGILWRGAVAYGTLHYPAYLYRGVVTADGDLYVSDNEAIYLLPPPA